MLTSSNLTGELVMDAFVISSLTKIKRGATLFLKNNEKVLFIKHHGTMITVLGESGLKNISYHKLDVDYLAKKYFDQYDYAS